MRRLFPACAFVLAGLFALPNQSAAVGLAVEPTYEEFVKLDITHRQQLWATLTPETRIVLARTHGERWLSANRGRLNAVQTSAVQAYIDFIPEAIAEPMNPESLEKEPALRKAIRCRVGENAFAEAFAILHRPPADGAGPRDVVDSWLAWLVDCVA
jgi:hypothetical protein